MKKLYKFYYDYSDSCEFLSGLFIESEDFLNKCMGKSLYFDIWDAPLELCQFRLDWSFIEEMQVSDSTIKELESKCGCTICGHNPLDYIID